nr:MAG TPA_asm: hypothetical protein [Caudoviricetes sp.]
MSMCCKGAKTSYLAALFVIKMIERRCCYSKKGQFDSKTAYVC